jgi:hypothetical protein
MEPEKKDVSPNTMITDLSARFARQYSSPLTMKNIVERTIAIMQWVESLDNSLTGPQKKQLVIDVLVKAADALPRESVTEALIEAAIPPMIDWLVVADRKGLRINPQLKPCARKCRGWFARCFSCCLCSQD